MEHLKNDSSAMRITSGPLSHGTDVEDMGFQIHRIETEAYGAVLRAFSAQSDVLSWGKEGLISDLRKELRVSDVEHREILGKISSDNSIKSIRVQCQNRGAQMTTMNHPRFDPDSMDHMSRKKMKPAQVTVSSSLKYSPCAQSLPTVIPSSLATNVREDQWGSKTPVYLPERIGQALIPVHQSRKAPSAGAARGSLIVQMSKKGLAHSRVENIKPGSDIIEIRATERLIHEVERVCGGENPDPAQVERAKLILRDHERALLEAIGKLADVSDGDESPDERHHCCTNEGPQRNGRRFHRAVYPQFDRTKSYRSEG